MSDLLDRIISHSTLLQIGEWARAKILDRISRGEYLPESTGGSGYSTTRMPMPFGALQKAVRGGGELRDLIRSGEAHVFKSKAGKIWISLEGGYKRFRELAGKNADCVTLQWSGDMLKQLNVTKVDEAGKSVTLGFLSDEAGRIASYHQRDGAGRSHVTHKFMGLTAEELSELGALAPGFVNVD